MKAIALFALIAMIGTAAAGFDDFGYNYDAGIFVGKAGATRRTPTTA